MVGLVAAQVIAYFQDSASPLLAAGLTVLAGAIPLFGDYLKDRDADAPQVVRNPPSNDPYGYGHPPTYGAPPRRRSGLRLGGLLVGLGLLVVVGGGIAYGATYAYGWVTGRETVTSRLAEPVSGSAGALDVRIDDVGVGSHHTHVLLTATNSADFPVEVSMFGNCQLLEKGGAALEAKVGFTTDVIDVPSGGTEVRKTVVFSGRPSDGATSLTLACSILLWQGNGQPRSLQVKGIALRATST